MTVTSRLIPTLAIIAGLSCSGSSAFAQIPTTKPYGSLVVLRDVTPVDAARGNSLAVRLPNLGDVVAPALSAPVLAHAPIRPAPRGLLPSLYLTNATMQILDAHSTLRALDAGFVEANPVVRWSASHPVAFVSLKAAATAGTVYFAERIRKKHPRRAALFMVGINAAYALVVVHNYRAVNGQRVR